MYIFTSLRSQKYNKYNQKINNVAKISFISLPPSVLTYVLFLSSILPHSVPSSIPPPALHLVEPCGQKKVWYSQFQCLVFA